MAAKQPQFYKKVVPLTLENHGQLHFDTAAGYGFARESTAVLLATVEFILASKEYPIVFLEDGDKVSPVALLGLPGSENQYVAADGQWDASYVPAYVRRYPFIPGTGGADGGLVLCIDEAAPGLNAERGVSLFKDGEHSPYLQHCISLLEDYQVQVQRTDEFSSRLVELKLLVPMKADLKIGDVTNSLAGFMVVDPARLKVLLPEQLSALVKNEDMAFIYAHLSSIENFNKIKPKAPLDTAQKVT